MNAIEIDIVCDHVTNELFTLHKKKIKNKNKTPLKLCEQSELNWLNKSSKWRV